MHPVGKDFTDFMIAPMPGGIRERHVRQVERDRSSTSHGVLDRDFHQRHSGHVEFAVQEVQS
jgi:hypothetical protein